MNYTINFETSGGTKHFAHSHGRHFSSPYSGTSEDPVTGTASGVMGAYYITYVDNNWKNKDIVIEQGRR